MSGFHEDEFDLVALQFAVVDAWGVGEHRGDVDSLYMRLCMEVGSWVAKNNRSMRMPTPAEFSRAVRLHLPLMLGIGWQHIEAVPSARRRRRRRRRRA